MVPISLLIACGIALAASVTDVWRFKVYNALTFPSIALGLLYHAVAPHGLGFQQAFWGVIVGLGILLFPYALGVFGAGDAKFVAAMGAWLGVEPLLTALVVGALVSGIYGVVLLATRGGLSRAWLNLQLTLYTLIGLGKFGVIRTQNETVQEAARTSERRNRLIPFSAMISVGVLYATLTSST